MANVLVPNHILVLARSISKISKLVTSRSRRLRLPGLGQVGAERMASTGPTSAATEDNTESEQQASPSITPISRPSIIKSVVPTPSPNGAVNSMQRPSVICAVRNSVLITENVQTPPPPAEAVLKPEDKPVAEVEVVDLSVEKTANEVSGPAEAHDQPEVSEERQQRVKTRKFVLMLSYSGTGYFGMQRNPGTKTIEDDLFQALIKNNYIDNEMYNRPQIMNFQRAARTDKGVSAARQIVSLKLPENATIEAINQHLPQQIRVQGMKRVTKGFDSKNSCDARTYSYMMPTFAFVPVEEQVTESYRVTPEVLDNVRKKLAMYVGCKNYHNFTSRKKPGDPSAQRTIMSFTCSEPFMQDGLEFVILRVKGQSFMMHQIRKMIGLATAIVRGFANDDAMERAFSALRIDIPRAPGLGLMLDQVHYERYDKKFGKDHETLTWDDVQAQVEEFCQKYIYSNVTKIENEEKPMFQWLETLAYHTYDQRDHEPLIIDGKQINVSETAIGRAARHVKKDRKEDSGRSEDDDDEEDDEEIPQAKKAKQGT